MEIKRQSQIPWDADKAALRRKFIALNAYVRKEVENQLSKLLL